MIRWRRIAATLHLNAGPLVLTPLLFSPLSLERVSGCIAGVEAACSACHLRNATCSRAAAKASSRSASADARAMNSRTGCQDRGRC